MLLPCFGGSCLARLTPAKSSPWTKRMTSSPQARIFHSKSSSLGLRCHAVPNPWLGSIRAAPAGQGPGLAAGAAVTRRPLHKVRETCRPLAGAKTLETRNLQARGEPRNNPDMRLAGYWGGFFQAKFWDEGLWKSNMAPKMTQHSAKMGQDSPKLGHHSRNIALRWVDGPSRGSSWANIAST